MTGSLQEAKGKYYSILNFKDEAGNRKQKRIPLHIDAELGNQRKAERARKKAEKAHEELKAKYESRKVVYSKDMPFHEFVSEWLEGFKTDIEENTYESYLCNLNKHIIPFFKELKIKVQDIEYRHIEAYYKEKRKTLSVCTLKKHHAVIKQALRSAVQNGLLGFNPAADYKFPKAEKKFKGTFLTEEQGNTLLEAAVGKPIEPAIILGITCGLRRSEIAGLRYRAIDFKANTITIEHSVTRFVKKVAKDRVKNDSSNRVLSMNAELRTYLLRLRARQAQDKLLLGAAYQDSDYVCRWPDGHPISCDYMSQTTKKLLLKCGLPEKTRLHDLRHSCASFMLKMGRSMKEISDVLGHSDIQTSMNIYAHVDMDAKKEIADQFGSMFVLNR